MKFTGKGLIFLMPSATNILLFSGDARFSSWTFRAKVALLERAVNFKDIYIGLDWPVRFIDGEILALQRNIGSRSAIALADGPGCHCESTQIVSRDPTGLIAQSLATKVSAVPILVDVDEKTVIYDTLTICCYIEEKYTRLFGSVLLPMDLGKRNTILCFCNYLYSGFTYLHTKCSFPNSLKDKPPALSRKATKQARYLLELTEELLIDSARDEYLFGRFSLADVMLSTVPTQFFGHNVDFANHSKSHAYMRRLLTRPSIRQCLTKAKAHLRLRKHSETNSPSWIASHYRSHPFLSLIHNPDTEVYHKLDNEVSRLCFSLASSGKDLHQILEILLAHFEVTRATAERDIKAFFKSIHPRNKAVKRFSYAYGDTE